MTPPDPDGVGFTVGPWKHSGEAAPPIERDPRVWIYAPDSIGNHPRIAIVEAVMREGDLCAINRANAALIAAAPDLFEALKLAEDVLARFPYSSEIWPNGTHPNTGIEQIRAALSKARSL